MNLRQQNQDRQLIYSKIIFALSRPRLVKVGGVPRLSHVVVVAFSQRSLVKSSIEKSRRTAIFVPVLRNPVFTPELPRAVIFLYFANINNTS